MKKIIWLLFLSAISTIANASPSANKVEQRSLIAKEYKALKLKANKIRIIAKIKGTTSVKSLLNSTPDSRISHKLALAQSDQLLISRGLIAIRKFPRLGLITVEVDSEQLDVLIDSGMFDQIVEDIPEPPALTKSTKHIGANRTHQSGFTGAGQAIAVLDSGFDTAHPFFENRIVEEACFSSNTEDSTSLCPNGENSQVGLDAASNCSHAGSNVCDHGTHVAGIVAGSSNRMNGVAPGSSIVAVQVFSEFPADFEACGGKKCILSYQSDQLAALEWILSDATTHNIAAINMSIGGGKYDAPCDDDIRAATIQALRQKGTATVIASGNSGYSKAIAMPGCISAAITVGSSLHTKDSISYFSNSSSLVDILAPGSSITSSVLGGDYSSMSGTSMAAPHVAGAIAVLREINPNATIEEIESALETGGAPVRDSKLNLIFPRLDLEQSAVLIQDIQ